MPPGTGRASTDPSAASLAFDPPPRSAVSSPLVGDAAAFADREAKGESRPFEATAEQQDSLVSAASPSPSSLLVPPSPSLAPPPPPSSPPSPSPLAMGFSGSSLPSSGVPARDAAIAASPSLASTSISRAVSSPAAPARAAAAPVAVRVARGEPATRARRRGMSRGTTQPATACGPLQPAAARATRRGSRAPCARAPDRATPGRGTEHGTALLRPRPGLPSYGNGDRRSDGSRRAEIPASKKKSRGKQAPRARTGRPSARSDRGDDAASTISKRRARASRGTGLARRAPAPPLPPPPASLGSSPLSAPLTAPLFHASALGPRARARRRSVGALPRAQLPPQPLAAGSPR